MNGAAEPHFLGDACLCWAFGTAIDRSLSRRILDVYARLREQPRREALGVLDLVPAYTALAVHASPLADWGAIRAWVEEAIAEPPPDDRARPAPRRHELPVVYDGEDLQRVADHAGLSVADTVACHSGAVYLVAMVGFRPHFPYLLGLDPRLATPRLDTPRLRVPAGAVAIGGAQAGVYPEESPGGWNIVGRTDPRRLPAIVPGDEVCFRAVEARRAP